MDLFAVVVVEGYEDTLAEPALLREHALPLGAELLEGRPRPCARALNALVDAQDPGGEQPASPIEDWVWACGLHLIEYD